MDETTTTEIISTLSSFLQFDRDLFFWILGIIIAIIIAILVTRHYYVKDIKYQTNLKTKNQYRIIWKKSEELEPEDIYDFGNYKIDKYYHKRAYIDDFIKTNINNNKNFIIIGSPLSGKTRAIYQNLKELRQYAYITIPFKKDIDFYFDIVPKLFRFRKKQILVLDDLNEFTVFKNFDLMLDAFVKKNILIIGSCRSKIEFDKLKKRLNLNSIFNNNIIEIIPLSIKEAFNIATQKVKLKSTPDIFDGTIGSLLLPLEEMKRRMNSLKIEEKIILIAIKILSTLGIYRERGIFDKGNIKTICINEGINIPLYKWDILFLDLSNKEFIQIVNDKEIWPNPAYIYKFVNIDKYGSFLDIAVLIINLFCNKPDILFLCGERIFLYGLYNEHDDSKSEYFKTASDSYEKALFFYSLENNPLIFANICDDLGSLYIEFFKINKNYDICQKSLHYLKKALQVRTFEKYPCYYSRIQNNLGVTYSNFFDISDKNDKEKYFHSSLEAYNQSLKIGKSSKFSIEYANIHYNMGLLYYNYALYKGRKENFINAIKHYRNAISVRTKEYFPFHYAKIKTNIGNTYLSLVKLAEIINVDKYVIDAISDFKEALNINSTIYKKDFIETCNSLGTAYQILVELYGLEDDFKKAISYFQSALENNNIEKFPLLHGIILNNIGVTYKLFAGFKEEKRYSEEAIKKHKEALNIILLDVDPFYYSEIQDSMGTTYNTHAFLVGAEKKVEIINTAIDCFKLALTVKTIKKYPTAYAFTQNNLGNVYKHKAELENIKSNCLAALKCYKNSLNIIKIRNFPNDYARINDNIGLTFLLLGSNKNSEKKLFHALRHFGKALEIRTEKSFPLLHAVTQNNLGDSYFELSIITDKEENLKKALDKYQIASKIFKRKRHKKFYEEIREKIKKITNSQY